MLIHTAEPYRYFEHLSERRDWHHRHAWHAVPAALNVASAGLHQQALNPSRADNLTEVFPARSGWSALDKTIRASTRVPVIPAHALPGQRVCP